MSDHSDPGDRRRGRLTDSPRNTAMAVLLAVGLALVLGGALTSAASGLGHRWGWWGIGTGFSVLRWGVYVVLAGMAVSAVGLVTAALLIRRWLVVAALPALVIGAAVIAPPLIHMQRSMEAPPIHDISTDLDDPPAFVALSDAREAAPNAVEHPGERVAQQQNAAYPGITTVRVDAEPEVVFEAAEALARDQGWRVVEANPVEGRIEAIDRTFWFGFRDDVVIRITGPEDGMTLIDMRSASRVGQSDLGTNARRVRNFLTQLQDRL